MARWPVIATTWLGLLTLLVACTAGGQGPSASQNRARDGSTEAASQATVKRISAGIRGAPKSLSQLKMQPGGGGGSVPGLDAVQELVHAGLVHGDDRGTVLPQLAEAVPSLENGLWKLFPDGRMETTWRIRDGAVWHDGVPLTAEDLLFTVNVEQDRELAIPRHAAYGLIERVEAPDPRTVTITWKQAYIEAAATFSYEVALPLPRHLLETPYGEDRASFLALPYWSDDFVGTGPYRVQEWVVDSQVVLRANERYVLGRPKIDEIEVRFVPDPNTLLANMLAGTELTMGRALPLDLQVNEEWQRRGGKIAYRGSSWMRIISQFVNPDPQIVTDVRFRRALLHAIDRQQMMDTLMGGLTAVAHTFVEPGSAEYRDIEGSIVRYDYDPRRSVELIEGLGYRKGGDGVFRDPGGARLAVEFRTTAQNLAHPIALAVVAGYWEGIGVAVEQVVIPVQRSQDLEYRATFPALELSLIGNDVTSRGVRAYHSASTPLTENQFRSQGNLARYMNPDLDTLIQRYVTTIPRPERMQALAQIVQHQTDQVTVMGVFHAVSPTLIAARLHNVSAGSSGGAIRSTEAWNAQDWEVR